MFPAIVNWWFLYGNDPLVTFHDILGVGYRPFSLRCHCTQDFEPVDPRFEYFGGALNRPYISDQMFGLKYVLYPNWQISILGSIFLLFLHIGNSL